MARKRRKSPTTQLPKEPVASITKATEIFHLSRWQIDYLIQQEHLVPVAHDALPDDVRRDGRCKYYSLPTLAAVIMRHFSIAS